MHVPAPTKDDTPFEIRGTLTIYEAAMVYADRHPYPHFFDVKDGSIEDHLEILKLDRSAKLRGELFDSRGSWLLARRSRLQAKLSWDIYCELEKRVKEGIIKPVRRTYDQHGKIDSTRTRIKTSDLIDLANELGKRPRYLRHLHSGTAIKQKLEKRRRGPVQGETGFKVQDRRLFPRIDKLINSGKARSPYGAALKLADEIAGQSRESKAKRVSALYRKERKSR